MSKESALAQKIYDYVCHGPAAALDTLAAQADAGRINSGSVRAQESYTRACNVLSQLAKDVQNGDFEAVREHSRKYHLVSLPADLRRDIEQWMEGE